MDASRWFDLHRTGETCARRGSCPRIMGDTPTHDEHLILIGWLWLKDILDHIVVHDSTSFARLDGANFIMEQTADVCRAEIPLKTVVLLLFSLNS